MNERLAELAVMVGTPGSGKTHLIKRILAALMAAQGDSYRALIFPANRDDPAWWGRRVLGGRMVLKPDPMKPAKGGGFADSPAFEYDEPLTFKGERVVYIDGNTRKLPAAVDPGKGMKGGAIVVDDFKNHIPSDSNLPAWVNAWLGSRRHMRQDIFLACHGFNEVPVRLLAKGPRVFVFQTTVGLTDSVWEKYPQAAALQQVVERVNAVNAKLPENERHYFEQFQCQEGG